jgi:tripartite ATP-independent transporter DctM subunit
MVGYFVAWLALIAASMPVSFSLIFMGMAWLLIEGGTMITAPQRLIGGIDSFPLLAVPCFILAGVAMNSGGVTDRIYGFAKALVGHFTGGLAHVNVLGSLIFSGMSGSAIADAGGLGILEIKAMKEDGYPVEYAGALTCASCIIGPLVPPSIPMVIYGVIANASVGSLFLAGIVPGFLTAGVLMIQVYFYARKRGMPRHPRASLGELWASFKRASLALVTPMIIMGESSAGSSPRPRRRPSRRSTHWRSACSSTGRCPGATCRGSSRSPSAPRRSSASLWPGRACSAGCSPGSRCPRRWPRCS